MAFKMNNTGGSFKSMGSSAVKHSAEKVLGKEQPVGPHSHPGEKVVAQGANVDDMESGLGAAAGSAQAKKDFETETESTTPSGATKAYKAAYDAMSIKLTGNKRD